jgi:hypothetical protein
MSADNHSTRCLDVAPQAEASGAFVCPVPSPLRRALLVLVGLLSVGLGVLGIFLPLLPTTPFLLLAAACFARSSPRLSRWLHGNRWFGAFLCRYRRGEGMPRHAKILTLILLWGSLAASAWLAVPGQWWPLRIVLLLVGVGVTVHLLCIRTYRQPDKM